MLVFCHTPIKETTLFLTKTGFCCFRENFDAFVLVVLLHCSSSISQITFSRLRIIIASLKVTAGIPCFMKELAKMRMRKLPRLAA